MVNRLNTQKGHKQCIKVDWYFVLERLFCYAFIVLEFYLHCYNILICFGKMYFSCLVQILFELGIHKLYLFKEKIWFINNKFYPSLC